MTSVILENKPETAHS